MRSPEAADVYTFIEGRSDGIFGHETREEAYLEFDDISERVLEKALRVNNTEVAELIILDK